MKSLSPQSFSQTCTPPYWMLLVLDCIKFLQNISLTLEAKKLKELRWTDWPERIINPCFSNNILLEKLPPYRRLFKTPAEGCSLQLQQWGPSSPASYVEIHLEICLKFFAEIHSTFFADIHLEKFAETRLENVVENCLENFADICFKNVA